MNTEHLDTHLDSIDADGYLLDASGSNGDQRYLSGFDASDPFVTLYEPTASERPNIHVLIGETEYGRTTRESNATSVETFSTHRSASDGSERSRGGAIASFVRDRDVSRVCVPERFPHGVASELRAAGIDVTTDESAAVTRTRAIKSAGEIDHIRSVLDRVEAAFERIEAVLASADVVDGWLYHGDDPLTGRTLTREIRRELVDRDLTTEHVLVGCGADSADPHGSTDGPIAAGESIVVDIFPADRHTAYHADTTRTFVVGEPDPALGRLYDQVDRALDIAIDTLGPGVTGEQVNEQVLGFLEGKGHRSRRTHDSFESGALHYVAHGIGLDVHELPVCLPDEPPLEPGAVVAVEPGLYYPEIGGVRLEDCVLITETGCERLSRHERRFVVD
ncbi:M24 family metallopeptidase [Halovivax gelatinilyticus]|uniref:M24 family metallopeptidase n=1 Tax=Halovivax gelatinilyticus TaxID=2961597 RepID=UPI0020CA6A2B|nr:Xaa-Pro peptidase family protein [Halovivax gelatinilyticus]